MHFMSFFSPLTQQST